MLKRIEILDAESLTRIFGLTTANLTNDELINIEKQTSSFLINWDQLEAPWTESHIIGNGEHSFHIVGKETHIFTLVTDVGDNLSEFNSLIDLLISSLFLSTEKDHEKENSIAKLKRTVNEALTLSKKKHGLKKKSSTVFSDLSKSGQRYKFFLVGLGEAGKSSLYYQFFENWSIPEIEHITATISRMQQRVEDEFIQESFLLNDLGGQSQFREQYLSDPTYFHKAAGIIFVINCQDKSNLKSVKNYFQKILEQVETDPSPYQPLMGIFVHKFDPVLRKELEENIFNHWFPMLQDIFRNYDLPYYLTSIYDNTARESMARFFIQSLPKKVMSQFFNDELILQAVKSLYPIINKLEPIVQNDVKGSILEQDLFESAQQFGREAAKRVTKQWQDFLSQKSTISSNKTKPNQLKLEVEPTGHFNISLTCPVPKEKRISELCAITHGLFAGLGDVFGYHHVEMNQTMIRNETSECLFSVSD